MDTNRIFATQYRASALDFLHTHRSDSSIATTTNLTNAAGGVYSLDFLGETLYGAELVNELNYFRVAPTRRAKGGIWSHFEFSPTRVAIWFDTLP